MEGVAKQTCMYNDKLVGLPMTIDCTLLYYNQEYLDKYNKELPKTWDDLIETGQYILNEEKKLNNTDFVPYNGLFSELEIGICSIYEFIYSFRNSVESSFPNIRSQEAVNALEKMKEIKEKLNLGLLDIFVKKKKLIKLKYGIYLTIIKYYYYILHSYKI
jgi:ABC-type glycerol-3-phosphate transport system substrate-binding protein